MIVYIVKSSLSLIILFGLYWFLLRKEKLFEYNRFFLVLSVVFSLLVPFISIPVNFKITPELENFIPAQNFIIREMITQDNIISSDVNISQPNVEKRTSLISISAILVALYISGVLLFLIRFLRNIYIVIQRTKSSEKINYKGYRIVLSNEKTDPCCFFSSIYLNRDDYLNGRIDKELLDHELEHAKQSHTIDILLIELVKIFYWFNPVHILYDRAIRINHEYLADDGVVSEKSDIKSYAEVLLSFITGRRNISLTSSSNHSFTKMRLLMMMKPGSGSFIYGTRIAMTLFMGTALFLLLSFKESDEQPSPSNFVETGTGVQQNIVRGIVLSEEGKPLKEAEIVCISPKYTPSGVTAGSDGRFAINDVRTDDSLVIGCFGYKKQTIKPDFTSEMIIKLTKEPNFPEIKDVYFRKFDFTLAKALVVVNGAILDYKANFKVNPDKIESYKILMDKEATDKYGEKGKDGVFEIVLYGNQTKSAGIKRANGAISDTSKYITLLSVNHVSNKGELVDIPVSNLHSASIWIYPYTIPNKNKKGRVILIMTRDFYIVKGIVVDKNGKPLSGVSVSVTDNPVQEISDKNGRFIIEDVKENAMLEFSLSGYKPYYLATSGAVFTMEMKIELEKDNVPDKDIYITAEKMPQYPGGEMELKKFIATNLNYPEEARAQKAEGVVIVRFVVNTKGNIEDVEILQSVHPAIDAEVLRIVDKLEHLIPGSQGGKPVDVYYTLPITFALPKTNTAK